MVIDGSTLEKRRDQRAEQLERFIGELTPEDRKGFIGKVNQWTKETGVQVVDAEQSLFDLNSREPKLREYAETHVFEELPPIVRRTPQQRIESLAARIKDSTPVELEVLFSELAVEYWKAGAPVAQEDLRAVAATLLNQTERKR